MSGFGQKALASFDLESRLEPDLRTGCSPNTNPPTSDHTVFQITKVVDKLTGQPIPINKIWIEFERKDGETLELSDENIEDHRIEVPVGASIYIMLEAPGYVD